MDEDDRTQPIRRRREPGDPANPVVLPPVPPGSDVDVDVVQEEERTHVLPDGTVVSERARVEQRSRVRELLPWILIGLLLALLVGGFAVWYFTRSSTKPVPAVVGLRIDDAVTRLQQDGFKVQIARQSNAKPPGVVFGQDPAPDTKADEGSTVRLLVSNGPGTLAVPNAVGLTESEARSQLVDAGFAVTTRRVFSDEPAGTVVAQEPAAGERVAPGTKVRLNVSKGSANVEVPDEVGNTVDQAQSELAAKGFKVSITRVPSEQPVDTVVAQDPSGGQARKGSTVRLSVSEGPPAATTEPATTTTVTTETTSTTP
jgi:beta-lactam-binding protein with PASTA domain